MASAPSTPWKCPPLGRAGPPGLGFWLTSPLMVVDPKEEAGRAARLSEGLGVGSLEDGPEQEEDLDANAGPARASVFRLSALPRSCRCRGHGELMWLPMMFALWSLSGSVLLMVDKMVAGSEREFLTGRRDGLRMTQSVLESASRVGNPGAAKAEEAKTLPWPSSSLAGSFLLRYGKAAPAGPCLLALASSPRRRRSRSSNAAFSPAEATAASPGCFPR